jgi:hypothetical protein
MGKVRRVGQGGPALDPHRPYRPSLYLPTNIPRFRETSQKNWLEDWASRRTSRELVPRRRRHAEATVSAASLPWLVQAWMRTQDRRALHEGPGPLGRWLSLAAARGLGREVWAAGRGVGGLMGAGPQHRPTALALWTDQFWAPLVGRIGHFMTEGQLECLGRLRPGATLIDPYLGFAGP